MLPIQSKTYARRYVKSWENDPEFSGLILNVLSPCLLEELIADVGDRYYSLIIDQSTMIDTTKVMCVMIRYFSKSLRKVHTTFYRLIQLESGKAEHMATSLKTQITQDGLKMERLLSIAVDEANAMVGEHNSVSSELKKEVPHLITIKCLCHSLHLCAEHACDVLPKNLDYFVKQSHLWFSNSTIRNIQYSELHKAICDNGVPKKIAKLSGTRWLARLLAIDTILSQWEVLELHFEIFKSTERGDAGFKAETLHQMYSCIANRLYLTFLHHSLKNVISVNKLFQSQAAEPSKLLKELDDLFFSALLKIVVSQQLEKVDKSDLCKFQFKNFLMSADCIDFGYNFNKMSKNCNSENLNYIKGRCREFLIKLAEELQKRVCDNIKTLEKMRLFCPETASSQFKGDITEVAVFFKNVCVDVDETIEQWNLLHRLEITEKSSDEYWAKFLDAKDANNESRFENIAQLAISLLSLPFSNATVERAFSIVNVVKDKLRNKMSVETAEAILRIRFHLPSGGCVKFEPSPKMFARFNSKQVYHSDFQYEILDAMSEIKDT